MRAEMEVKLELEVVAMGWLLGNWNFKLRR